METEKKPPCKDRNHYPPTNIHHPHQFVHVCPSCGETFVVTPNGGDCCGG